MASTPHTPPSRARSGDRAVGRASERALQLLTEQSSDVLCELRDGEIAYVSPNAYRASGRAPEEFQGQRFIEFVHPDDAPSLAHYMTPGWTGAIAANVRLRDANGAWQWREVRGVRALDEQGIHSSVLVLRDISARVALESAIRESERRFRELADGAPFVIYMTDENFRTVFVNKAMLDFTGRTFEEQLAVPLGVNRHPDDAAELREKSREAIARRERFTSEHRYANAAGEYRWLLTDAQPRVDHAGNYAGYVGYSIDITERRLAEESLLRSEERARALLTAIPDLMFRITRDGVYRDFKAERGEDLYVAPEKIIGGNIRDLLPADVAEPAMAAIERALDEGNVQTIEYMLLKHGEPREYEGRITACGSGEVVVICRDVTDRNRAEHGRRESEQRLRLIFHNAPLVLFEVDRSGTITAADGKGLEAVELRAEDLVGFSAFDLYADAPEALDALTTALDGEAVTITVDVRGVVWHAHLAPVRAGSEVTGVIGVAVNLTDRVRAERALAESEERYRDLVEGLSDVLFTLDGVGNFTSINAAGTRLYGPDVLGANFSRFIDPRSLPAALEHLQRELQCEGVRKPEELLTHAADGREIWVEVQASPIIVDGEVTGIRGIARDITERKAAERQVNEAEDREAVLRERQRIAQELHDSVAQYFFSIGMTANAALADDRLPAELKERFALMRQLSTEGGQEIRGAIHALADEPTTDINVAMQVLFEPLRADATDVRYTCLLGSGTLPERLQREILSAARECLFNVRKHANAMRVFVTLRADHQCIALTVSDDGTGDAARIERVVEQGGGYGLRSMRARIRSIGGDVTWENNDGAGIRVTAVLPRNAEEEP